MNLLNLFKLTPDEHRDQGQLFEKISELGADLDARQIQHVTATAGLCGRMAYADTEFTSEELDKIKSILHQESHLNYKSINIVMTLMVEQRVELLTLEEHFYIRLANESMTAEEKRKLLRNLFLIAAADGTICLEEENLLFTAASQLNVPRQEIVSLKREFKQYLSVFQTSD